MKQSEVWVLEEAGNPRARFMDSYSEFSPKAVSESAETLMRYAVTLYRAEFMKLVNDPDNNRRFIMGYSPANQLLEYLQREEWLPAFTSYNAWAKLSRAPVTVYRLYKIPFIE